MTNSRGATGKAFERCGSVLFAGAWLIAVTVTFSATASVRASQLELTRQLEALTDVGAPAAILIVRQGTEVVRGAVGIADLRGRRIAKPTDHWRIASVTKMVTAVVVMQLVREGRVELDNPVSRYLPGTVQIAGKATVRQLLNHTSGIPEYLDGTGVPINVSARGMQSGLMRRRSFSQLLADTNKHDRLVQPGEMHVYSNTNYLILERLIEKVTGQSYQNVVRQRILKRLGLANTGFVAQTGELPRPYLHGYVSDDGPNGPFSDRSKLVDVTRHTYFLGADGGLFSTLDDLATLMSAIWAGTLLTSAERDVMMSDLVEDHDGLYRYGMGIASFKLACGVTVVGHEGRDLGSYTLALTDRSRARHFVLAFNTALVERRDLEERVQQIRDQVFCTPSPQ